MVSNDEMKGQRFLSTYYTDISLKDREKRNARIWSKD